MKPYDAVREREWIQVGIVSALHFVERAELAGLDPFHLEPIRADLTRIRDALAARGVADAGDRP